MKKLVRILALLALACSMPSLAWAQKKEPKPAAAAKPAAAEPIDINTATEDQLKAIKGIGDAYAAKIVAGRPYAKKDQLVSKKVLPKGVYEKIKNEVVAKQGK
jgi:DNA uptake protein ComE-like DNA-binding protein